MPIMMPVILLVKMSSATMMIMSNNLKDACHHSSNIGQHRQHQWDAWQSFHLNFELASVAHDDDDNVDGGGSGGGGGGDGGGGGGGSDDENYGDLPIIPKKRQKSLPPNVSAAKFP